MKPKYKIGDLIQETVRESSLGFKEIKRWFLIYKIKEGSIPRNYPEFIEPQGIVTYYYVYPPIGHIIKFFIPTSNKPDRIWCGQQDG